MLDRISKALKGFGITPEAAQQLATDVAHEAAAIGSDMLGATVSREISNLVRPSILRMRNDLLATIAGEPPAGFAIRLRARGNNCTDQQAALLWADMIASIAEQPATSTTSAEEVAAVA